MFVVYLIFTAAFALIAWRDLQLGLLLMITLLPSYLLRTEIFGLPTTLLEMLLVAFVTIWCIRRRPHVFSFFALPRSLALPIFLLVLASFISLFIAPDLASALGIWKAYFLEPMLLFFIIRFEHIDASRIFKALGITALFLSLVAILQWLTGQGIPIPWDIEGRVTSVFEYPNALGLFLGPIVIIGALSWRQDKKFWITTILLSAIAIVLAQSEAAVVAVLATLVIAGLSNKQTRNKTLLAVLTAILLITLSPWRGFVMEKLTLQDYSGQVRLTQWSETVEMLKDHWLFGAGLSGYPTVFEPYHQATHIEIFQYPHNIILNIWVELGLLGVIAFILLAYQAILEFWRRLKPAATTSSTLATFASLFALLEITIHGLVDVPYFKNDLAILTWILLAIIFSDKEKNKRSTPYET